jgi:plasmid replication initiation protein
MILCRYNVSITNTVRSSQLASKYTPKAGTVVDLQDRHVNMSNALARSAHNLSLTEKRVIACGIASTNSMSGKDATMAVLHGGWRIRISAVAYKQLKDAAQTLKGRTWSVQQGKKTTHTAWMGQVVYHDGEGWIELDFSNYTAPHLLALKKNFTSYKLAMGSALRSVYSWRLMECLMSWKSTGVWHVTLGDFQHAMSVTASHKANFGMLRRSVIEAAIRELRDTQNMVIDYQVIKAGRKVASLIFTFEPNPQTSLFDGASPSP